MIPKKSKSWCTRCKSYLVVKVMPGDFYDQQIGAVEHSTILLMFMILHSRERIMRRLT
jgi:hypothetical protein